MPMPLSKNCRCCLVQGSEMFDVFVALDEFGSQICDLIANCGSVRITEADPFSKTICQKCLKELINAERFRKRCLDSEHFLKNSLSNVVKSEFTNQNYDGSSSITQKQNDLVSNQNLLNPLDVKSLDTSSIDQQNQQSKQLTCETRYKLLKSKESLLSHKVEHKTTTHSKPKKRRSSVKQTQVCEICGKQFSKSGDFKKHARIHTGERPHECDECGKRYIESSHLAKHKRGHLGERNFKCHICGKLFMCSNTLAQHMHTHSDNLPHTCDICSKGFYKKSLLVYHMRTHTGDRPYQCDICGRKLVRGNLRQHMRIHIGDRAHKCDICGKEFAASCHLMRHIPIHTGERPHKCSHCGKGFIQSSNLTRHMITHSNQQQHECDTCGKKFPRKCNLIHHSRSHSNRSA
ncbi:zinc finger protein 480-like [Malaya genurostris]|uniref:zinc finger protein 480-like n=1 Tax=Malaya genurostris TaxID=325434 RepID=UPI0026F3F3FC|nr:zinc finger protein 480-like [Malaya genurostris]